VNLKEGTRRTALLLGGVGAILGGFVSCMDLQSVWDQRTNHNRFERLANSDVVQHERKTIANWTTIEPTTGERIEWADQVDKGDIKTIQWSANNDIESITIEDGQMFFPTPAPSVWEYLWIPLFTLLGFFIPWGAIRAIGWVVVGFLKSTT
jgi:hypothetical protein